jgi:hypothetical protein
MPHECARSQNTKSSFEAIFSMKPRRALVVLQADWSRLRLSEFLREGEIEETAGLIEFMVDVLDVHNVHGLFVRSFHREEAGGSGSEVFIPWKYVEGILWPDDLRRMEQRAGFHDPV